jgi:hypothetical protein
MDYSSISLKILSLLYFNQSISAYTVQQKYTMITGGNRETNLVAMIAVKAIRRYFIAIRISLSPLLREMPFGLGKKGKEQQHSFMKWIRHNIFMLNNSTCFAEVELSRPQLRKTYLYLMMILILYLLLGHYFKR